MPQITNTTNADIWFPQLGVTVPANEFINSDVYPVQDANSGVTTSKTWIPSGLTINTTADAMDPLWVSTQAFQTTSTYQLPATILPRSAYSITIYCASGTCGIKFNSASNSILNLASAQTFVVTCQSRTIDTIYLTPAGGGTTYVTIRKA